MLARRLFLILPHCYATCQLFATPVSSTLPPSSESRETQEKHRFSNHLHVVVAHPKTTQNDVPSSASPRHMVDELTGTTIRLPVQYFFEQADRTIHTAHQTNVPQMDTVLQRILHTVTLFAKENLQAISELYIDLPKMAALLVLARGVWNFLAGNTYPVLGFQTNPWGRGVVPYPPQAGVAQLLEQFFISAPNNELSGNFVVHEEPRFVRITGYATGDQLVGNRLIGHDLMSLVFRHFDQLDCQAETESPYLSWRYPIEPDF
ncbi:hypothetical protein ACQJBY_019219 [Aegilops geniculata]